MTSSTDLGPGEFVLSVPQCDTGDPGGHTGKGFNLSAPKDLFLNKPPSSVAGSGGGVGVWRAALGFSK